MNGWPPPLPESALPSARPRSGSPLPGQVTFHHSYLGLECSSFGAENLWGLGAAPHSGDDMAAWGTWGPAWWAACWGAAAWQGRAEASMVSCPLGLVKGQGQRERVPER